MSAMVAALLLAPVHRIYIYEDGFSAPTSASCMRNKTLHIIRHAEGHHNADEQAAEKAEHYRGDPAHEALRAEFGIAWVLLERVSGRRYHDPLLTAHGREQAYQLRTALRNEPDFAVDAVVFSPMRRTIETALLSLPPLEAVASAIPLESLSMPPPRLVATDLLRERVGPFMCDSRLSRSELAGEYGRLALNASIEFGDVSERDDMFASGVERDEPEVGSQVLAKRAAAALRWLAALPERRVAVVSHRHILGAITGLHPATVNQLPFGNCERRTLLLCEHDDETTESEDGEDGELLAVRPVRARVQPLGLREQG